MILRYAPNPHFIPHPHQPRGLCPVRLRQGEVEAQGEPPHPGTDAAVDGTFGWRIGLLDRHDALSSQDKAHSFQDSRATMDGPLGGRLGAAGKAGAKYLLRTPCAGTPNPGRAGCVGLADMAGKRPLCASGPMMSALNFWSF